MSLITVWISGKAWNALPIGGDPYYTPDTDEMRSLQASARRRKTGRGYRVRLTAPANALATLANWYRCDGSAWLGECESREARSEARAVIEAATVIENAILGEW